MSYQNYYNETNPKLQIALNEMAAAQLYFDNLPENADSDIFESACFGLRAAELNLNGVLKEIRREG